MSVTGVLWPSTNVSWRTVPHSPASAFTRLRSGSACEVEISGQGPGRARQSICCCGALPCANVTSHTIYMNGASWLQRSLARVLQRQDGVAVYPLAFGVSITFRGALRRRGG